MKTTSLITALTLTTASFAVAVPMAGPEAEPVTDLETRAGPLSTWAFYVSSDAKCANVIYADAGLGNKGCTNLLPTEKGGSVNFVSASLTGTPIGTFYAGANCQGVAVTAKANVQCVAGTIKSYKVT